jgi:hypothetical protein
MKLIDKIQKYLKEYNTKDVENILYLVDSYVERKRRLPFVLFESAKFSPKLLNKHLHPEGLHAYYDGYSGWVVVKKKWYHI